MISMSFNFKAGDDLRVGWVDFGQLIIKEPLAESVQS